MFERRTGIRWRPARRRTVRDEHGQPDRRQASVGRRFRARHVSKCHAVAGLAPRRPVSCHHLRKYASWAALGATWRSDPPPASSAEDSSNQESSSTTSGVDPPGSRRRQRARANPLTSTSRATRSGWVAARAARPGWPRPSQDHRRGVQPHPAPPTRPDPLFERRRRRGETGSDRPMPRRSKRITRANDRAGASTRQAGLVIHRVDRNEAVHDDEQIPFAFADHLVHDEDSSPVRVPDIRLHAARPFRRPMPTSEERRRAEPELHTPVRVRSR